MRQALAVVVLSLLLGACAQMPGAQQDAPRGQKIPKAVLNEAAEDLAGLQAVITVADRDIAKVRIRGTPGGRETAESLIVTSPSTKLYARPSQGSEILSTFSKGTWLPVLKPGKEWHEVVIAGEAMGGAPPPTVIGYIPAAESSIVRFGGAFGKPEEYVQRKLDEVLHKVVEMKKKWDDNPYLYIPSFSVSMGLTNISVSVTFGFK